MFTPAAMQLPGDIHEKFAALSDRELSRAWRGILLDEIDRNEIKLRDIALALNAVQDRLIATKKGK